MAKRRKVDKTLLPPLKPSLSRTLRRSDPNSVVTSHCSNSECGCREERGDRVPVRPVPHTIFIRKPEHKIPDGPAILHRPVTLPTMLECPTCGEQYARNAPQKHAPDCWRAYFKKKSFHPVREVVKPDGSIGRVPASLLTPAKSQKIRHYGKPDSWKKLARASEYEEGSYDGED